ncbi:type II toxin-antitoxin system RelE/ParE family toxin [Mycobacterium tilburgii]|uniref:type II toxin-antitoxin system RelE/ParE family toxin n=1 Tax=Mycobacterium tilburgii TaxID=44467 RepID=UPI003898F7BC
MAASQSSPPCLHDETGPPTCDVINEFRVLFAFDPWRIAVLLVAGDKSGRWGRWYKDNIPIADEFLD